ncbi:glycerophosphodiester phosphodiesterase family protein [uncultured Caulobacter sp.]|uniref:glycerophosphodiester phosphodiesterase family protein n=1 Tax=uncultured Caulobacter sp. TaxID=158749 RepID=UPI002626310A|nr:glycerophosphodiester phosphodiesterase family protein [uncultured Caulobacter sp.]
MLIAGGLASTAQASPAEALRKLNDPNGGVFVVAHRGCHNPAPSRGLYDPTPENSLQAMDRCVALGVDMVETDVRRTKDGVLVIMHDETVNRTTNGAGRVADMTVAEFKRLRLRQNFGGAMSPMLTDEAPSTLDEFMAHARGRIMLNLDIKEPIYAEVAAAVTKAGLADQMLVKADALPDALPLVDQAPYRDTLFMPMLNTLRTGPGADLAAILKAQASGHRRISAVELVFLRPESFPTVSLAAREAGVRLWNNTLTAVGVLGVVGYGGDLDALRAPDRVWGRQIRAGISVFQTDEPAALLDYLAAA